MRAIRLHEATGLRRCRWPFVGAVCLAAALVQGGEVITDDLTSYQEASFYGDVNIAASDAPTNAMNLCYTFDTDESGVVSDLSGNGNTGTVSGAAWTSTGKVSGAYAFDGTNSYIQASDSASVDIRGAFTLSLWVRIANVSGNVQALVCKHDDASARAYVVWVASGLVECQISSSGGGTQLYDFRTVDTQNLTNWTHLAVVWGGVANAGGAIYVNGASQDIEATLSTFSGTNIYNSSQPLRMGSKSNGGWLLGGAVDEVRIYDRALSVQEIGFLYTSCITNAQFQVSRPAIIEHIVPQGDIGMGSFTNAP